ncbi:class I SAM-dependent methyltransferase [Patescibacteria group bacterium]|nr:class I SAM-dependent methyltransferase [Patescibacteria group bacterium]MCG2702080.1 class I SAM-dependent methyltransferase [Candidatus Parcubacteria bacterium]MBU4210206.1 class I SAM-dependent methyltransferase [Patescibacteria group bacterium]MBU4265136.1 class I SAM-dependent methyltransferase [Patescibacteria group bacterium]MBU4390700.1 class I SAM-dependent methyltransferase [Patescibacteria group bacterium]
MKIKNSYDWILLLKEYKKIANNKKNVIEIGSSNKSKTKQLAKHCKKCLGIEYYAQRIPKSFKNIKYKQGDWQKLNNVKSNTFEILISSHTLEHTKNDLNAINETYRVLKPNGIGLITTPNRKRLIRVFVEFFTGKKKFPYQEHQREYTYQDLKKILIKSKFKKYKIIPVAIGLHAEKIKLFSKKVPKILKNYACYWLIKVKK